MLFSTLKAIKWVVFHYRFVINKRFKILKIDEIPKTAYLAYLQFPIIFVAKVIPLVSLERPESIVQKRKEYKLQ